MERNVFTNSPDFYPAFRDFVNPTRSVSSVSGTVDTSVYDVSRQGTELTLFKYYSLGMCKIWSGKDGNALVRSEYGVDRNYDGSPFSEADEFNAQTVLRSGVFGRIECDSSPGHNSSDGTVGILGARESTQTVYGASQNINVPSYDIAPLAKNVLEPYVEGRVTPSISVSRPFVDKTYRAIDVATGSFGDSLDSVLSAMTSRTMYISNIPGERFATSGYDFENAQYGTDSLAYGGMTYR